MKNKLINVMEARGAALRKALLDGALALASLRDELLAKGGNLLWTENDDDDHNLLLIGHFHVPLVIKAEDEEKGTEAPRLEVTSNEDDESLWKTNVKNQ